MAAFYHAPRALLTDSAGNVIIGGSVKFFQATTANPLDVYQDAGLTTPWQQPIASDASGRLPVIYMTPGTFKVQIFDADNVSMDVIDNLDTGNGTIPQTIAQGGTGATTAANALVNLGAASAADVSTLSTEVAAILAQITAVGGTLGALAGLSSLPRANLATGFGLVAVQRATIGQTAALVTCATTVPYDNTIPQISEGNQIVVGTFQPMSASSLLEIAYEVTGSNSSTSQCWAGVFRDAIGNALDGKFVVSPANPIIIRSAFYLASPGTSSYTFQLRAGSAAGTFYANGATGGTQIGNGTVFSRLSITEWVTY